MDYRQEVLNRSYSIQIMDRNNGVGLSDSDHIVSVHNNPFFKTYGIRTQRPERSSDDANVQDGPVTSRSANIKENDSVFDEDDPGEYRPGSGFVFKLLGKFSSLTAAREENNYRPKRTSSLENLLEDNRRDLSIKDEAPRRMLSSLSKSTESVNHIGNNLQPLKIPTSSFSTTSDSYDKRSRIKSPRDNGDASALRRDDIILIEKDREKTEVKLPVLNDNSKNPQVIGLKNEVSEVDELPKPNTVFSVRSMFEKTKASGPMPIYSTATGPVVVSPTNNIKQPAFTAQKVSKVTPSLSTEATTNNVSKLPTEVPQQSYKKRPAPQPPVSSNQQDLKTGLPTPKPRNKQSPVIAVAPFVNDSSSNEESSKDTKKSNKELKPGDSAIWPEESVSKVFDSSAVIKPPVAPARPSRRGSNPSDSNSISNNTSTKPEKTNEITKRKEKPPRPEKRLDLNGTDINSKQEQSEPESPRIDVRYENNSKFESIFAPDIPQSDLDTHLELHQEPSSPVDVLPEGDGPVKGIPRFIAERLQREGNKTGHHQSSVLNSSSSPDETDLEISTDLESALKRKRKNIAPAEEPKIPRDTTNTEILNFRKNLKRVSESKNSKVAEVFSTAEIVRTPVPKLDLSSITDDHPNGFYQEGYKPTVIEPCKIVFIGANVRLPRSSLGKSGTAKGRITFNDNLTETFEYLSEESSLQMYIMQHPNEPEDIPEPPKSQGGGVLILEGFGANESSDDFEDALTPRESNDDDIIKSNPALSHSDAWSNYRSKYQTEDFTFGAVMDEPEPPKPEKRVEEQDENSSQIVPADEETTWSTETTSDLLF